MTTKKAIKRDRKRQETGLSDRKKRIIAVVLSSPTITDGCRRAHVSRDVWYDNMKDSLFRAEYERQSKMLTQNAIDELRMLGSLAVMVQGNSLRSLNENIRLRAAESITGYIVRLREAEIEDRLTELERLVEQRERR